MADEEGQLIISPQPSHRQQFLKALHPLQLALRSEHSKNEGLLAEREYLLQLIELRNEHWARHVSLLESRIEQMKAQEVKLQQYNASKLELFLDAKERKAFSYKEYAELVDTDLEDAHTCIAALGAEIKDLKSKLSNAGMLRPIGGETLRPIGACDSTELKDLKLEIKKLKHGYRTLKSEKEAQLSEKESRIDALVCEKDFVWNQLTVMESKYVADLKSKNSELDKSNEAITMLKKNLEEMEASILEKDRIISKMKEEMSASISEKDGTISQLNQKFLASISEKDDMISRLKKMLKEKDQMISGLHADVAKFASRMGPICKPVDSGTSRTLRSGTKRAHQSVSWAQPSASQSVSGQHQHSNRLQGSASISTAETPRLFSSTFKVPKLKSTTITSGTTNAHPK